MRKRHPLGDAALSPELRAAVEARRVERETKAYQEGLQRDIEAIRREYPPKSWPT